MRLQLQSRAWHTNLALLLLGAGLFELSRQLVREYDSFTIGFSGVSGWSAIFYLAACAVILLGKTDRFTLPIILGVALLCRLTVLYADPYLSSDVYRYVWDGLVQHAHISPYRYVPGDPALHLLRAPNQEIFDNINRRDYAHTIYPPAAQLLFYLVTAISPTVTFMKTVMVAFEGITIYALLQLLAAARIRREQILLYAWCPLLIWEIAGAGHLDSVAMALITLALLARYRNRPIATGLFLALAILTKMYPIILLPALYQRSRAAWKMPATVAVVLAFGYAAYASVGALVFGFLGGYAQEEGLNTGVRYFLLAWAQRLPGLHLLPVVLPVVAFYLLCAAIFAALSLWAWRRAAQPDSPPLVFLAPAFALAAALMLLFSPHYAWYLAWLVPFLCLLPNVPVMVYVMGFFYGYTTALADPGPKMFLLNEYLYTAVCVAALLHLGLRPLLGHHPLLHSVLPSKASEPLESSARMKPSKPTLAASDPL
jgi:alpha-1,6-mannosyltransferase